MLQDAGVGPGGGRRAMAAGPAAAIVVTVLALHTAAHGPGSIPWSD